MCEAVILFSAFKGAEQDFLKHSGWTRLQMWKDSRNFHSVCCFVTLEELRAPINLMFGRTGIFKAGLDGA